MEQRTMSLEIRSQNLEERKIEGYASVFSEEYIKLNDRWGDVFYERIKPGAFTKTLRDKIDNIFMLINHDWTKVVGKRGSNLVLEEDSTGLRFELTVPNTTDGSDLLENVRLGLIPGCSFGFNITDSVRRWDDSYENLYIDITEVDLFEITATPIPAYGDTSISARSNLDMKELRSKLNVNTDSSKEEEQEERNAPERNNSKVERSVNLFASFFMSKI